MVCGMKFFILKTLLLIGFSVVSIFSQNSSSAVPHSLQWGVGFDLPLGETGDYYTQGGSSSLSYLYTLKRLQSLSLGTNIDYAMVQMENQSFLSRAEIGGQTRLGFFLSPSFMLYGLGQIGFSLSFADIGGEIVTGSSPFYSAGAGASFYFSDKFGLWLRASYKGYFGFYSGLNFSLGTDFKFSGSGRRQAFVRETSKPVVPEPLDSEAGGKVLISIDSVEFSPIFPVFYNSGCPVTN
jgi:hypothetical protein